MPSQNVIGFGPAGFVELAAAVLLCSLWLASRGRIGSYAAEFAARTAPCMLLLGALPVILRLLLLVHNPVPAPAVSDDFSYVLLADTLRHFRLANPPHPLPQFFETFFVLQEPTYSSIYPLGQGIVMAAGWLLFGHPWAGVALSTGALCALCYWMLRAWTTPGWSLVGGLLSVFMFGPLSQWMNSYWGGAVSGCAGCLVFGALPRLRQTSRMRDALLLGAGMAIQILTRPFESVLLGLSVVLFLLPDWRSPRALLRRLAPAAALAAVAVGLTTLQNRAVTGSAMTMPYQVSRVQYGVPTTFTFQPLPIPHRELTREQQLDYEIQSKFHGDGIQAVSTYLQRLGSRVRYYRFFFLPPLYLALPFFMLAMTEFRYAWLALTLCLFSLGTNFYPYFYSHYIAAVSCLFILVSVTGLQRLSKIQIRGTPTGDQAARVIVSVCAAQFLFWYGIHLFAGDDAVMAVTRYETWDAINHGDPEGRIEVRDRLTQASGQQLVFVRYGPQHTFKEWVHNEADIDKAKIVWARDLGPAENAKLQRYYPNRAAWLLEPDARPVRLTQWLP